MLAYVPLSADEIEVLLELLSNEREAKFRLLLLLKQGKLESSKAHFMVGLRVNTVEGITCRLEAYKRRQLAQTAPEQQTTA